MPKLVAQKFAGQEVWIGSGLVSFNQQGVAVGNVRSVDSAGNVTVHAVPADLVDEQYRVVYGLNGFRVIGWSPGETSDDSEEEARDAVGAGSLDGDKPDDGAGGDDVAPETEAAPGVETPPAPNASATAAQRFAPPKNDWEAMTRVELYQYLRARGIDVGFLPREELLEIAKRQ